jgi:hypothetical protein
MSSGMMHITSITGQSLETIVEAAYVQQYNLGPRRVLLMDQHYCQTDLVGIRHR